MTTLFDDKSALKFLYEDNQSDAREWWWLEEETKTVFIVSYCPANSPALVVHRLSIDDARQELWNMLSGPWKIVRWEQKLLGILDQKEGLMV